MRPTVRCSQNLDEYVILIANTLVLLIFDYGFFGLNGLLFLGGVLLHPFFIQTKFPDAQ